MTPALPRHHGYRPPEHCTADPTPLPDPTPHPLRDPTPLPEPRQTPRPPAALASPRGDAAAETWESARRRVGADQWQRRRLLERQLHDGASLRVSALALRLGLLREQVPGDTVGWRSGIDQVQDELHAVLQELREVAAKIYPPLLDQAGLAAALRELVDQAGLELTLDVAYGARFGAAAEGAAYFGVAGCLAARPPDAPPVTRIAVRRDQDDLVLRVDGATARDLRPLLDQARPLGGTAELVDNGVAGTETITVRIPCE